MITRILILFIVFPTIGMSQNKAVNSREFYPPYVDSNYREITRTVKVTVPKYDTILTNYQKFTYKQNGGKRYLIVSGYNVNMQQVSRRVFLVSPEGLGMKSIKLFTYSWDGKVEEVDVKIEGESNIDFPFINLDNIKSWRNSYTTSYSNKNSDITNECIGVDSIMIDNKLVETLIFKTSVRLTYEERVYDSETTMYLVKGKGIHHSETVGHTNSTSKMVHLEVEK